MFKTGDIVGFQLKKDPEIYIGKIIRVDPTSGSDIIYYLQYGEREVYKVKKSEMVSSQVVTKESVDPESLNNSNNKSKNVKHMEIDSEDIKNNSESDKKPKKKRGRNKKLDKKEITV